MLANSQINVTQADRLGRPSALHSDDKKTLLQPRSVTSGEEQGYYSTIRCGDKHGDKQKRINPLNAELNPICHLLALLGTHPILHVSRIRDKCNLSGKINCEYNYEYPVSDYTGLL